jgi:hypothetical protein
MERRWVVVAVVGEARILVHCRVGCLAESGKLLLLTDMREHG